MCMCAGFCMCVCVCFSCVCATNSEALTLCLRRRESEFPVIHPATASSCPVMILPLTRLYGERPSVEFTVLIISSLRLLFWQLKKDLKTTEKIDNNIYRLGLYSTQYTHTQTTHTHTQERYMYTLQTQLTIQVSCQQWPPDRAQCWICSCVECHFSSRSCSDTSGQPLQHCSGRWHSY